MATKIPRGKKVQVSSNLLGWVFTLGNEHTYQKATATVQAAHSNSQFFREGALPPNVFCFSESSLRITNIFQ